MIARILADAQLAQQLSEATGTLAVVDAAEKMLGFFDPIAIAPPGVAKAKSPHSDAELEELRKQKGGRSLAEILRDLEKLG